MRPTDPIDVLFLVLPDTLLLDLAGPAEAFRLANQHLQRLGRPTAFRMRFVGAGAEATTSVGLQVANLEPLPQALSARSWVVVLGRPGSSEAVLTTKRPAWLAARHWLAKVVGPALDDDAGGHRLLTVCVGALLAADAGLVGRRQITTHHEVLDALSTLAPHAQVCANRVFVVDGPLWSSAGITAGIDLALHCVGDACGDAVAAAVAETMVVFQRRGVDDPERSPLLAGRSHLHPAVHRVQNANTNGRVGYCLALVDLFLSKAAAGREKDREFCMALLAHDYVKLAEVLDLVRTMPLDAQGQRRVRAAIQRWAKTLRDDGHDGVKA